MKEYLDRDPLPSYPEQGQISCCLPFISPI